MNFDKADNGEGLKLGQVNMVSNGEEKSLMSEEKVITLTETELEEIKDKAYNQGYDDGYSDGDSYDEGYDDGYEDAEAKFSGE